MNDDLEARIAALERRYLELESSSLFQVSASAVLVALIEYVAETQTPLRKLNTGEIRRIYETMICDETEKLLATIADDQPALATKLRGILKEQLDKPA